MADTRTFQGAGGTVWTLDVPPEGTDERLAFDEKLRKRALIELDKDGNPVDVEFEDEVEVPRPERRNEPAPGTVDGDPRDERRCEPTEPGPEAGEAVPSIPMDQMPGSVTAKGVIGEDGELLHFSDQMVRNEVAEPVIEEAKADAVSEAAADGSLGPDKAEKPKKAAAKKAT